MQRNISLTVNFLFYAKIQFGTFLQSVKATPFIFEPLSVCPLENFVFYSTEVIHPLDYVSNHIRD